MKVVQPRIARAEIVERDPDAHRTQLAKRSSGGWEVAMQDGFGYLDLQTRRRQARGSQGISYHNVEVALSKLDRRQIHSDPDASRPLAALSARLHQDPCPDLTDDAHFFRHRYELPGPFHSVVGA